MKRKYNRGYFVQHKGKAGSTEKTIQEERVQGKVQSEQIYTVAMQIEVADILPNHSISPSNTSYKMPVRQTDASYSKLEKQSAFTNKTIKQKKALDIIHKKIPVFDPSFNDASGPLVILAFILLTILYAAALMEKSTGGSWLVALAIGAVLAGITLLTGVTCL